MKITDPDDVAKIEWYGIFNPIFEENYQFDIIWTYYQKIWLKPNETSIQVFDPPDPYIGLSTPWVEKLMGPPSPNLTRRIELRTAYVQDRDWDYILFCRIGIDAKTRTIYISDIQ